MDYQKVGRHELAAIDGTRGEETIRRVAETSPLLSQALVEHAFGTVFASRSLSRIQREIVSAAVLGALGSAEPQLKLHLNAALRVGVDPDELIGLVEHVSVYAGYPRALNMLSVLREVLDERGSVLPKATAAVRLGDHTTRLFDTGGGRPPLILVHALGLDWRMWRDVIPQLEADFRIISYDLRGFGTASGAPAAENLAAYARDLAALFDELGLQKAHIAGLSLGGSIGQQLALARPELIRTLTLIATTAWPSAAFSERAQAARREGMSAQIIPSLTRWFTPEALAENGWAVRYARDCINRAMPGDWCAGWNALASIETGTRLADIAVPTHVVSGEHDVSTSPELMQGFQAIPGASHEVIANAPHMVSLTHPTALAEAIRRGIHQHGCWG